MHLLKEKSSGIVYKSLDNRKLLQSAGLLG